MLTLDSDEPIQVLPDYVVIPPKTEHVTVKFYFDYKNLPKERPNVSWGDDVVERKHYRKSGYKWWTSHAVRCYYVSIPRKAFEIQPINGYSFPKFIVNGVKLTLSTVGWSDRGIWTDSIAECNFTGINLPKAIYYKIAELAIPMEHVIKPCDIGHWQSLYCESKKQLEVDDSIVIQKPYSPKFLNCTMIEKTIIVGSISNQMEYRVKRSQVDWLETARANKRTIPTPEIKQGSSLCTSQ